MMLDNKSEQKWPLTRRYRNRFVRGYFFLRLLGKLWINGWQRERSGGIHHVGYSTCGVEWYDPIYGNPTVAAAICRHPAQRAGVVVRLYPQQPNQKRLSFRPWASAEWRNPPRGRKYQRKVKSATWEDSSTPFHCAMVQYFRHKFQKINDSHAASGGVYPRELCGRRLL